MSDKEMVSAIIKDNLRWYGYGASDACVESLAKMIEAYYAERVEKAWQYDELCE